MGNSFWILFAALNNLKPLNLTIAEVNVFSYSLCETVCPLHYGVINRHWALDVTEKCLRVVWSHVLFPPRKCNTRCANLFFAPGNLQNRTWAPNWNRALKPTTEERPSELQESPSPSLSISPRLVVVLPRNMGNDNAETHGREERSSSVNNFLVK